MPYSGKPERNNLHPLKIFQTENAIIGTKIKNVGHLRRLNQKCVKRPFSYKPVLKNGLKSLNAVFIHESKFVEFL